VPSSVGRIRGFAALVIALCGLQVVVASAQAKRSRPVTVMTYNFFQGSELSHAVGAKSFLELPAAVGADYANVIASNIPARANAIAAEIKAGHPDLVGLQEAVLWRTARAGASPFTVPPNARTVAYDSVGLLVRALGHLGLHYRAVAITNNADLQATVRFSDGRSMDVRFTDRVAILARNGVKTSNVQQHNYVAHDSITLLGIPLPVRDGWASVDAKVRGKTLRFLTTHLDGLNTSTSPGVRAAEAKEIIDGPAHGQARVILTCDCNATPSTSTYRRLSGASLRDTWAKANPGKPGLTCCHRTPPNNPEVSLTDPSPTDGIVERIDYVFARGPFKVRSVTRIGTKLSERTSTTPKLWPSDHFGVLAALALS
jgi:endonuclease/exonuclease/phosphatase family metal-dependent hydrolase